MSFLFRPRITLISHFHQKLNSLLSDNKFIEILTGSTFAFVGRIFGIGLAMLSSILIARIYGAKMMGVLAIVQAFMMMAAIFAVLGTNISILRLIPEHLSMYSLTSAFRVYRKTQYFVALVSILVGCVLFFNSSLLVNVIFSKPHLSFYIALTSLCLIFKALMDLNTSAVRGLSLIKTFAFMQVLPQASMLIILLILVLVSRQSNDPVYAQLAAWGVTALVGGLITDRTFRRRMQPGEHVQPMLLRELIALSAPMLMTASMGFIIGQSGVLILGIYRPASEVGYYAAAVKLSTLTSFVLQAINSMAAPKFSELFHTDQLNDLFYVAKKSTKLIFWSTTPILLFLMVLGFPVLSLFGEKFSSAYVPMLILVAGQFVNSISGSTGCFMNMTGNQVIFRNIIIGASGLNLLLNFLLTSKGGMYGAAIAGAVSLALWNIWTLVYIKMKYGRTIGYLPILGSKIGI
jgi:O-antigen/teichoic acid export membrane protein